MRAPHLHFEASQSRWALLCFLAGPDEYHATRANEAGGDRREYTVVEIEHAHDAGGIGSGICRSRFETKLGAVYAIDGVAAYVGKEQKCMAAGSESCVIQRRRACGSCDVQPSHNHLTVRDVPDEDQFSVALAVEDDIPSQVDRERVQVRQTQGYRRTRGDVDGIGVAIKDRIDDNHVAVKSSAYQGRENVYPSWLVRIRGGHIHMAILDNHVIIAPSVGSGRECI